MFNTSQSCIPSKKHTRQLEPGPIWSYTSVSNPDIFFSYYPLSNTFSYFISLMQYQQPKRQKNIHSSRFVATCQSDETLQQKKEHRKELLNHHIFVGNMWVCACEELKLTTMLKGIRVKMVIRQKHIISSVGESLSCRSTYIYNMKHEVLHMVYRIFVFSVSGAFCCKIK